MGCIHSHDTEDTGWCGMSSGTIKQPNETASDAATEESKSGQKPSEVLRLGPELTNGLLKTYQKVRLHPHHVACRQSADERD